MRGTFPSLQLDDSKTAVRFGGEFTDADGHKQQFPVGRMELANGNIVRSVNGKPRDSNSRPICSG
jgi:hypothetical protein